tara:strand:+ start:1038 stop:1298 length:261 start_codon:yes stop_codon:yes gene_type:complete
MPPSDALLEMMKQVHADVVQIRDNHLAHIAEDISEIKIEQAEMKKDIALVMDFKDEVESELKSVVKKVIGVGIGVVATILGLPVVM